MVPSVLGTADMAGTVGIADMAGTATRGITADITVVIRVVIRVVMEEVTMDGAGAGSLLSSGAGYVSWLSWC